MTASDTLFDSRGGFSGSSYLMKTAKIERLRVVAMATSFGTKIAINWLCVNNSDQATGGGCGRLTECRYCRYPAPTAGCYGSHFLAFDGL